MLVAVGCNVEGWNVGLLDGRELGDAVGFDEGAIDGLLVGRMLGRKEG